MMKAITFGWNGSLLFHAGVELLLSPLGTYFSSSLFHTVLSQSPHAKFASFKLITLLCLEFIRIH